MDKQDQKLLHCQIVIVIQQLCQKSISRAQAY